MDSQRKQTPRYLESALLKKIELAEKKLEKLRLPYYDKRKESEIINQTGQLSAYKTSLSLLYSTFPELKSEQNLNF